MDLEIKKSKKVSGKITPSPSKFYTQFATAASLLAEGKSVLKSPLLVDDTRCMIKAIENLGATTKRNKNSWTIWGNSAGINPTGQIIDAKKSMMSLSLLTSLAALTPRVMVVTGSNQVRSRPIPSLLKSLQKLGVDVHSTKSDDSPPLVIYESKIEGGKISFDEKIEPNFLPAFMLISPFTENQVEIKFKPELKVSTTSTAAKIMKKAGIEVTTTERRLRVNPGTYNSIETEVPLDIFSTLPYVLGAVLTDSELRISEISDARNVNEFKSLLEKMGVEVEKTTRSFWIRPQQEIKSRRYSLENFPEVIPFAAVLACKGDGKTKIINAERARNLNSDRISATAEGLRRMGANVEENEDGLTIESPANLNGTKVNGYEDDAIVAALAVAGLIAEGKTTVENRAETLRESYPHFVSKFQNLGSQMGYKS